MTHQRKTTTLRKTISTTNLVSAPLQLRKAGLPKSNSPIPSSRHTPKENQADAADLQLRILRNLHVANQPLRKLLRRSSAAMKTCGMKLIAGSGKNLRLHRNLMLLPKLVTMQMTIQTMTSNQPPRTSRHRKSGKAVVAADDVQAVDVVDVAMLKNLQRQQQSPLMMI